MGYIETVLYRLARNTYQRILNRSHYNERKRLRDEFRPYTHGVVFDIGAHRGHYAETFRELGATVVAVEPNPVRADEIRRHFPGITVVQAAVGAEPGTATLNIGADDQHSTLSKQWAATHPERWTETITVPVTTLDVLIETHGVPALVKIDVEGYEADVLRGLSTPVETVVFEYQADMPDPEPFLLLSRLGDYTFSVGFEDVVAAQPGSSGDVFARLAFV